MNETILLSKHQVVRHLVLFFYVRTVRSPDGRKARELNNPYAYLSFPEDCPHHRKRSQKQERPGASVLGSPFGGGARLRYNLARVEDGARW